LLFTKIYLEDAGVDNWFEPSDQAAIIKAAQRIVLLGA
jgi:hypothetical protein